MILVVALDLRGPATSYDLLYDALKKQGVWWHNMRWTWLLDTEKTPEQIVDTLKPFMSTHVGDRMLIVPLTRPYQGLLAKDEWEWIRSRLSPKKASGPL